MSKTSTPSGLPDTTLDALQSITTAADAEAFIDAAAHDLGLVWGRVGDMNNTGTIESGSGPKNALGEIETNGIDES
ncbi:hypothetical protein SAMN04487948_1459 [Halogranum amylolyticum]|uniref:Uncharacterized protein n=1 Tax=Halogranum amylolyticum TaxID=660520 RepID=A0A1H8WWI8_9EURY|nr:hypothetical protein [Halogranum amylolyticum]SEP31448.1 hypothetical protein SAMN04487948_1459 [Halogranum amylolyticum]